MVSKKELARSVESLAGSVNVNADASNENFADIFDILDGMAGTLIELDARLNGLDGGESSVPGQAKPTLLDAQTVMEKMGMGPGALRNLLAAMSDTSSRIDTGDGGGTEGRDAGEEAAESMVNEGAPPNDDGYRAGEPTYAGGDDTIF